MNFQYTNNINCDVLNPCFSGSPCPNLTIIRMEYQLLRGHIENITQMQYLNIAQLKILHIKNIA